MCANASDLDELVVSDADADLLAVLQTAAPVRVGVDAPEVVVLVDMPLSIVGGGPPQGRLGVDRIHAGISSATGSNDANMPTLGTIGMSFSA